MFPADELESFKKWVGEMYRFKPGNNVWFIALHTQLVPGNIVLAKQKIL